LNKSYNFHQVEKRRSQLLLKRVVQDIKEDWSFSMRIRTMGLLLWMKMALIFLCIMMIYKKLVLVSACWNNRKMGNCWNLRSMWWSTLGNMRKVEKLWKLSWLTIWWLKNFNNNNRELLTIEHL
jgi:hypothetical protein